MRKAFEDAKEIFHSHAGLMLSKYPDKKVLTEDTGESRLTLLLSANRCLGQSKVIYEKFVERHKKEFTSLPGRITHFKMQTSSRLIIGLGSASVLETGLTLHHTYGIPYIPGSALKGLAAHYCHKVLGADCDKFRMGEWDPKKDMQVGRNGKYYEILFGNIQGKNDDESASAGFITFHDAFMNPGCLTNSLRLDIMTPHHKEYYDNAKAAPTDFDDPTPISYLSVDKDCEFTFYLTCCDSSEEGGKWLDIAKKTLRKALGNWGIGGKTSSGYGRMK